MYTICGFHLWNGTSQGFTWIAPQTNHAAGLQNIVVSYSTDGGTTFTGSTAITCEEGPDNVAYTGKTCTLPKTACNAIRFTLASGNGTYTPNGFAIMLACIIYHISNNATASPAVSLIMNNPG